MKMKFQLVRPLLLISLIGLLSACISIPTPQPDLTNPILTVAILPFSNMSNNVDAPDHVRKTLEKKLTTKFYKVLPLDQIDQTMVDELGVTLGEQLAEVDFKEIKSKINADAYIFGHISHYDQSHTGVLNTNRVRAEMKMVQNADESVFWSSALGIKSESKSDDLIGGLASLASAVSDSQADSGQWITIQRKTGGDGSALGNLISGLVEKAVSSMTNTTLTQETLALVNHSTRTLRNGPGFK